MSFINTEVSTEHILGEIEPCGSRFPAPNTKWPQTIGDESEWVADMKALAASSVASVLLLGETGTGKSHCAREIHRQSARRSGPFIDLNLATLSEGLIESELFGCERGAFTGADRSRRGRIEMANGGTLFLDEIGELPLHLQARLLDVIQFKRVTPLGSTRAISLDFRIIAATNRDLESLVAQNKFREDLWHRIRVIEITMPKLTDRREDFDALVHGFLSEHAARNGKRILRVGECAAGLFEVYSWPGNVRELGHAIEFAVIACKGPELKAEHLPRWLRVACQKQLIEELVIPDTLSPGKVDGHGYAYAMDQFERVFLQGALRASGGQLAKTAKEMGLSRTTLFRRLRYHGLSAALPRREGALLRTNVVPGGNKKLSKKVLRGASPFCNYVSPAASHQPLSLQQRDRGRSAAVVL